MDLNVDYIDPVTMIQYHLSDPPAFRRTSEDRWENAFHLSFVMPSQKEPLTNG